MDFIRDIYQTCEQPGCSHDLGRGVLVSDLLCCDGPHTGSASDPTTNIRYRAVDSGMPNAA